MTSCPLKYIFLLIALFWSSDLYAQIPFYTDDADTTAKGKFHVEFFNEHDWLQKSSLPGKRQNTSNFTLNYGLTDRIELGINAPVIKIVNAHESMLGNPMGIGDTQFGVKVRLRNEREGSRLPAMSVVFYFEAPTASTKKQIGSGLPDYWLYGVLQKSFTKRTVGRLNGGILFAGNSSSGLIGIRTARGQVFTGNGSLVRDFTKKLKLGAELFGGVTNNFNLSRGQLQAQFRKTLPYGLRMVFIGRTVQREGIRTKQIGKAPTQASTLESRVYVSNRGGDTVSVIYTTTNTVVATVAVGDGPTGVALK